MLKRQLKCLGAAIGVFGLVGAASSALAADTRLLNVSYDPTRELYTQYGELFAKKYKAETGNGVVIEQSNGGSGKQARSVIDGLNADVVTLALGWDITAIERAGLINLGWEKKFPYNSAPYTSTIAFLVRKGNPKGIHDWQDLFKPSVQVITANPKTSGGARWVFLALWGSLANAKTHSFSTAKGQEEAAAASAAAKDFPIYQNAEVQAKIAELFNTQVPVLDAGARGATVTFAQKQIGDVLLNWENELWLARDEFGPEKFDIVYPSKSILTEPPVAIVDKIVDQRGTRAVAEAYLKGLYAPEAQDLIGQLHYRPRNLDALKKYSADLPAIPFFTIDETYGGWTRAQTTFFADGGVFDQIYKPTK
jgi:sulfate/thiosulfate transport system substrate-binding protein